MNLLYLLYLCSKEHTGYNRLGCYSQQVYNRSQQVQQVWIMATKPIDQIFAERKLDALLTAWESAQNPRDPKWLRLWAAACQAAGIGLCEDGVTLQPPAAWRAWARQPA